MENLNPDHLSMRLVVRLSVTVSVRQTRGLIRDVSVLSAHWKTLTREGMEETLRDQGANYQIRPYLISKVACLITPVHFSVTVSQRAFKLASFVAPNWRRSDVRTSCSYVDRPKH